jgi:hypothetical protein
LNAKKWVVIKLVEAHNTRNVKPHIEILLPSNWGIV